MNNIYTWEYDDSKDRWPYWYIIALSIIVWIVIWGFITWQYWMSFVVLFVSGLFYYIENNSEDNIEIILTDLWFQIWKNFYEYAKIEKYTFIYEGDIPVLLRLVVNKASLKNIDLKIDKEIFYELKDILPNYIQEDAKWELTFMEKLIHKLKL